MVIGAFGQNPKSRKLQSKCHKSFGQKKLWLWMNFMMICENARKMRNDEIVFGPKKKSLGFFIILTAILSQIIFANPKDLGHSYDRLRIFFVKMVEKQKPLLIN